ncbi:MAG TPA: hypothetical protein DCZ91_24480 [Lachnospiraceae bacterium]|nr:hypothetical protein [Lachnospiraceae bacterium]
MRSYLSLIPISARVRRRQNRMTILCIIFAVFLVTAVFSMAEMVMRMEVERLKEKHEQEFTIQAILDTNMGQNLFLIAGVLFVLILIAGVLMISGSINSTVAQRTKFFGMMRCIGMSHRQLARFVKLEALNWCKTAVPAGVVLGIGSTWILCAILRFVVREEYTTIPLFGISLIGIVSGIVMGVATVLLAARSPAKRAARVSPLLAVSGNSEEAKRVYRGVRTGFLSIDAALGVHHAKEDRKNLFLMAGSFALSIILFLTFTVLLDLAFVSCVYGFLVIIALVSILNIMNSISLSVSGRMRQYGAMRAVGMEGRQITKMISAEAVTYALSGCVTGCILGLAIGRVLYNILIEGRFPYAAWTFPGTQLLIVMVYVLAATFAAVHAPSRRMRNMAVTETTNEL